jgi:hypothetical protein
MGVSSSSATLEIQLVADVARLQRDMAAMKATIGDATSTSTRNFATMATGSATGAAQMAASAQSIARNAVTSGKALKSVGQQANDARIAMLEATHIAKNLGEMLATGVNPARAMAMEMGRMATLVQYSGGNIGGLVKQLGTMLGVTNEVKDAVLAEAAAEAAAHAGAVQKLADRAAATLVAREAQVALLKSQVASVEGTELEAAAQTKLVKALRGAAAAATASAVANEAAAVANVAAGEAAVASTAATTVGITGMGAALIAFAAIAVIALGGYLIYRLMTAKDAVQKLVDKLQEHYEKTLQQAEADKIWADSLAGVAEEMDKISDKIEKGFTTEANTRALELVKAQNKLVEATKAHTQALKELAVQQAILDNSVNLGKPGLITAAREQAEAQIVIIKKKIADSQAAMTQTTRAINDLQIASAAAQGQAIGELGTALNKRVDDMQAMLENAATTTGKVGLGIKASMVSESAALAALKKAFTETGTAGEEVGKKAVIARGKMEQLVDQLRYGVIGPDKFTKSILDMASALDKAAKAAKGDPFAKFEAAINGAEGKGPNLMGSHASGWGQFMPGTWLGIFDQVYPQFKHLSDATKLAMRDNASVAKGMIDAYAHQNADYLKRFGQTVTATNLMLAHQFGGKGAVALLTAAPSTSAESVLHLGPTGVAQNKLQGMTAGQVIAQAAKKIGDSSGPISEGAKALAQWDDAASQALAMLESNVQGQEKLADAYLAGDAAVLIAEADQKAEAEALRLHADGATLALLKEKELALAIAQSVVEGAKHILELNDDTAARKKVNDMVEAGLIPLSQANTSLQYEKDIRSLVAAAANQEGEEKQKTLDIIKKMTKAQADNNAELAREAELRQLASNSDDLDRLQLEVKLIAATNRERAVALAQLAAQQFAKNNAITDPAKIAGLVQSFTDIANMQENLTEGQNSYNNSLTETLDKLSLLATQVGIVGQSLANAFGGAGQGIADVLNTMINFQVNQAQIAQEAAAARKKAGDDMQELARIDAITAAKNKNNQLGAIQGVIGGLKTMFKEHSVGYKAMAAAEKAFAIIQAISTIKSVAAGAAKMFSQLGVWAFPVVAAMIAVMAALGFSGGSSAQTPPTSAKDLQEQAGTGTVLGSPKDKSASIANSLELMAANSNKDLEYSNDMLKSLRSIDFSIGKLAGTIAKQIQVSGSLFDTSSLHLGTTGSSGFLGLFSSSTTKSLYDLGIKLSSASVGDIIANGISGNTYQIVEKIKKKSGFLGIGGGTKTTYTTTTGTIDPEITAAIQGVITSLRDGLVSASKVIGLEGAEAILNSFNVSLGTISFKDMTGKEIEDQLNAIFSKVGDQMAEALFPALKSMQKIGEGLFETFMRVAKEYQAVDIALKSIGKVFGAVGVGSIEARDALVQLFDGLENFISATAFFHDQFLSEAEQIAPVQASVIAELQRLGISNIITRDQFKNLVLGLDLTTDAGRQMYASLLKLAPAFDKVLDYFDKMNQQAIQNLTQTINQFNAFIDSLKKYRETLFQTDVAQEAAYKSLRAKFVATAQLAGTGDATALGGLEQAGKNFLSAANDHASTLQDYLRDVALVARGVDKGIEAATAQVNYAQLQLDQLQNAVSILGTIAQNTTVTAAILAGNDNAAGPTVTPNPVNTAAPTNPSASGDQIIAANDLSAQVSGMRTELNAALQAIAVNTGSSDRTLKRWDRGDTLAISVDDDAALNVNLASWGGSGGTA